MLGRSADGKVWSSAWGLFRTAVGVPQPPRGLKGWKGRESTLLLLLPPPATADHGAPIDAVQVQVEKFGGECETHTVSPSTDQLVIRDLEPGTVYSVRQRASNSAGWGPYSADTQLRTWNLAGRPDVPALTTSEGKGGTVRAVCELAAGSAKPSALVVEHRAVDGPMGWTTQRLEFVDAQGPWRAEVLLGALSSGTVYAVRGMAVNDSGHSAYTPEQHVQCAPTAPAAPTIVVTQSASTTTLRWSAPAQNGGAAISVYRVAVWPQSAATDLIEHVVEVAAPEATSPSDVEQQLVLADLRQGTEYCVRAVAVNDIGSSPPFEMRFWTAPPQPNAEGDDGSESGDGGEQESQPPLWTVWEEGVGFETVDLAWTAAGHGGGVYVVEMALDSVDAHCDTIVAMLAPAGLGAVARPQLELLLDVLAQLNCACIEPLQGAVASGGIEGLAHSALAELLTEVLNQPANFVQLGVLEATLRQRCGVTEGAVASDGAGSMSLWMPMETFEGGTPTRCSVRDLDASSWYRFRVRCTDAQTGKQLGCTPLLVCRTNEAQATAPAVGGLMLDEVTAESLRVAWQEPAAVVVTRYQLRYRLRRRQELPQCWRYACCIGPALRLPPPSQHLPAADFPAGSVVEVAVRACVRHALGAWSASATVQLNFLLPGACELAEASTLGPAAQPTALPLRWRTGWNGGAACERFEVRCRTERTGCAATLARTTAIEVAAVGRSRGWCTHTLTGLEPCGRYRVAVRAANSIGWGAWSTEVMLATPVPPSVTEIHCALTSLAAENEEHMEGLDDAHPQPWAIVHVLDLLVDAACQPVSAGGSLPRVLRAYRDELGQELRSVLGGTLELLHRRGRSRAARGVRGGCDGAALVFQHLFQQASITDSPSLGSRHASLPPRASAAVQHQLLWRGRPAAGVAAGLHEAVEGGDQAAVTAVVVALALRGRPTVAAAASSTALAHVTAEYLNIHSYTAQEHILARFPGEGTAADLGPLLVHLLERYAQLSEVTWSAHTVNAAQAHSGASAEAGDGTSTGQAVDAGGVGNGVVPTVRTLRGLLLPPPCPGADLQAAACMMRRLQTMSPAVRAQVIQVYIARYGRSPMAPSSGIAEQSKSPVEPAWASFRALWPSLFSEKGAQEFVGALNEQQVQELLSRCDPLENDREESNLAMDRLTTGLLGMTTQQLHALRGEYADVFGHSLEHAFASNLVLCSRGLSHVLAAIKGDKGHSVTPQYCGATER